MQGRSLVAINLQPASMLVLVSASENVLDPQIS